MYDQLPPHNAILPLTRAESAIEMTAFKPSSSAPSSHPQGPRKNSRSSAPGGQDGSEAQINTSTSSKSPQPRHAHSLPPLSPSSDKRDSPGSRTRYYTPRSTQSTLTDPISKSPFSSSSILRPDSTPLIDLGETTDSSALPATTGGDTEMDTPHAPYREPEAVIEPNDDAPPGYVIAEHPVSDDGMQGLPEVPTSLDYNHPIDISSWQTSQQNQYEPMDLDNAFDAPEKPRIGPGVLPRRLLELVHEHPLFQPSIRSLPQPGSRRSHTPTLSTGEAPKSPPLAAGPGSASTTSMTAMQAAGPASAEYDRVATEEDVWKACPGGVKKHHEWYFCPRCWGWLRIVVAKGDDLVSSMEEWELLTEQTSDIDHRRATRYQEWSRYNDIKTFRMMNTASFHHFHRFDHLVSPTSLETIPRIDVEDEANAFPHLVFGMDQPDSWSKTTPPFSSPRLYVDSGSDLAIFVDGGPYPGQLPVALVNDFTSEKMGNPRPGANGATSVKDAWNLIIT